MAKARNNKSTKSLHVAIALGVFIAIIAFGGQLTGNATLFATPFDLNISSIHSCTAATMPADLDLVGGASGSTSTSASGVLVNTGNVVIDLDVKTNETNTFPAGTTVRFDPLSTVGATLVSSGADITMTTTDQEWCSVLGITDSCTFNLDFNQNTNELPGEYNFTYTVTCRAAEN